ncbi:MAG: FeoB-associated Cys-rich membrane protein [Oscillospiraceae bacterium]
MSILDIALLVAVGALVCLAIYKMHTRKASGKGCCGDCSSCGNCGGK